MVVAAVGCSDKSKAVDGRELTPAALEKAMTLKAKDINDSAPYLMGELRVERAETGPGPQLTVFYTVTSFPDAIVGKSFSSDHEHGNKFMMCRAEATKLHAGAIYKLVYAAKNSDPLGTFTVAWKDCVALGLEKSLGQESPFGMFY